LLSRRAPRAALRAPALFTCAVVNTAAVERYVAAAADELRRCGGSTNTHTLAAKLVAAGVKRPTNFKGALYKLLKRYPNLFAVARSPSSTGWFQVHLRPTAGTDSSQSATKPNHVPEVKTVAAAVAAAVVSDGLRTEPDAFICAVLEFLRGCTNGMSSCNNLGTHLKSAAIKPPAGKLTAILKRYPTFVKVSGVAGIPGKPQIVTLVQESTVQRTAPPPEEAMPAASAPLAWRSPPVLFGVPPPRPGWAPSDARTDAQRAYAASLDAFTPYVVAVGPAGTGKTHLAVQAGAVALLTGAVSRLVITRPAVTVDEDLGYLPGGIDQKMAPFIVPVLDLLSNIWSAEALEELQAERRLQVVPLGFMRGRTFDDAFILADEMQNCSKEQMQTLLTRLGVRSRLVLTGDPQQCDRTLHDNGLVKLLARLRPALKTEAQEEDVLTGADDAAKVEARSFRDEVASAFALHELDASSVQRHAAVRTALRLLGGEQ
jgi:hypothetical protein